MRNKKSILKPCPFCGACDKDAGAPGVTHQFIPGFGADSLHEYSVRCHRCGAETDKYETSEEAIEAWNIRAKEGEK